MDSKFVSVTQMRSTFVALHPSISEDKQPALQQKKKSRSLAKITKKAFCASISLVEYKLTRPFLLIYDLFH